MNVKEMSLQDLESCFNLACKIRDGVIMMARANNNMNTSIDRDVTFVSLCNSILNLSTEPYGGGTIYTFNEFGEEQSIPYSDARLLIRNNKRFIYRWICKR